MQCTRDNDFFSQGGDLYVGFGPKTRPRTLFNCCVLNKLSYEAKQLRNVLEHVLELNVYIQNQSLNLHLSENRSLKIAKNWWFMK